MRDAIRVRQYSLATERNYVQWVRRFILFHGKRHPAEMGKEEIEAFLTYLAIRRGVSPSTRSQALQALLFLYRHVLAVDLPWLDGVVRARPRRRVPVVLRVAEVKALLANCTGEASLAAALMYGSGLRAMECLRLRIGDLDMNRRTIRVHAGKGGKDRVPFSPNDLSIPFQHRLPGSGHCTSETSSWDWARPSCQGHCGVSWESPAGDSTGSFYSPVKASPGIRASRIAATAGTFIRARCARPLRERRRWLVSRNELPVTPCGIRLQRICSNGERTSA